MNITVLLIVTFLAITLSSVQGAASYKARDKKRSCYYYDGYVVCRTQVTTYYKPSRKVGYIPIGVQSVRDQERYEKEQRFKKLSDHLNPEKSLDDATGKEIAVGLIDNILADLSTPRRTGGWPVDIYSRARTF